VKCSHETTVHRTGHIWHLGRGRSAKQALRAAGYNTQILDDVDDYSQATWVDVWRPIEAADCNDPRFDQEIRWLNAIVDPLGGLADEYGLGEYRQPREEAYPTTWTREEGWADARDLRH
jgi:hypothetical protein